MQRGGEVPVSLVVAVADENALVAGQYAAGVNRVRGPVPGVHVRQPLRAGQVHVPHPARGAGRGLVRVHRLRLPQQARDQVHEPAGLHQDGSLRPDPGDPAQPTPGCRPSPPSAPPPARTGRSSRRSGSPPAHELSGPKDARARTPGGRVPSVTSPQHGHIFDCATCSATSGSGAGMMSVTWWRRCANTSAPSRPVPHPAHSAGGYQYRYFGLSTRLHRGARLARLLARRPFPLLPQRPVPRGFFLYGLSDDGGLDDVDESRSSRFSSRPTRALSSLISRYASASRAASSSCGRAASSSADGRAGTHRAQQETMPPQHPARPAHPRTRTATRPITSNNTLTLAE